MGRLWAGIDYRSDHINGMRLGRAVARLIIDDIEASCIPRFPDCCPQDNCAPPPTDLCERSNAHKRCCESKHDNRPIPKWPTPSDEPPKDPFLPKDCSASASNRDVRESGRGPQKGGISGQSSGDVREQGSGPQEGGS